MAYHPDEPPYLSGEDLRAIRRADPDGWETQEPPTEEQYKEFDRWVTNTYGKDALKKYKGIWEGND